MNVAEFIAKAHSENGPKVISGFSRPVYHNWQGLRHGYKYDKNAYGGMIRHTEAGMLYTWATRVPAKGTIVEIGCYGGLSTSYLLSGLKDSGKGGKICSIDPFNSDLGKQADLTDNCVPLENKPDVEIVADRLRANGFDGMFELIEGYSQEVAKTWDRPIDFLWIDGNHEQAYQDFKDFEPWLNDGAIVGVHDAHPRYGYEAVVEDVKKIFCEDSKWSEMEHVKSIIAGRYKKG